MKSFIDQLVGKIEEKDSHICVGLDPHPDMLPLFLLEKYVDQYEDRRKATALAILEFNKNIIDHIAEFTPAVKPQAAFYELLGINGLKTLFKTIEYAQKKGLMVILDAKRNDIGSTAAGYARAYLGMEDSKGFKAGKVMAEDDSSGREIYFQNEVEVDCLTINPYLGYDGIEPFLRRENKGAFALVKTSNDSGGDIQDLVLEDGTKVYSAVAGLVSKWGQEVIGDCGYSNLGAVIGATYPRELEVLREEMPTTYFLIPGFGFQGGEPEDIICGFNPDGRGAIVNSSRGINFAYQREPWKNRFTEQEYAEAAGAAAENMKQEINELRKNML
ncbi:MAG: orotidine-5'-phosphate decarboxylase [Bacillota bacterium]